MLMQPPERQQRQQKAPGLLLTAHPSLPSVQDFVNLLPANECRFGVVDIDLVNSDGCQMSRIVFVNWAPDAAAMMLKMKSASTKQHFKNCANSLSSTMGA